MAVPAHRAHRRSQAGQDGSSSRTSAMSAWGPHWSAAEQTAPSANGARSAGTRDLQARPPRPRDRVHRHDEGNDGAALQRTAA